MSVHSPASSSISDCIGIGFGPANIALAIALEEVGQLNNTVFLEQAPAPDWQGEFLISGSDIQHNPIRDFVTPRNPVSPYGFLSYLKKQGRLFDFLNLSTPFPPRSDYARYVVWVARQFDRHVRYSSPVSRMTHETVDGVPVVKVETASGNMLYGRTVSFAPGRSPRIPDIFRPHLGSRVAHSTCYRSAVERWQYEGNVSSIAVLGASQSAVEMMLDLPSEFPSGQITGICRSYGIKQKDLSPFSERIYEPEFVNQFYHAPQAVQADLRGELWRSNYGAADHDVINALQFRLYEQKVTGRSQLRLIENTTTTNIVPADEGFTLSLRNRLDGTETAQNFDAVLLATGFMNHGVRAGAEPYHPLLSGIAPNARFRTDGAIAQARDYQILMKDDALHAPVFLNGVSETTHGFGDAGSFSLLSIRSGEIAASIAAALVPERFVSVDMAPVTCPMPTEVEEDSHALA